MKTVNNTEYIRHMNRQVFLAARNTLRRIACSDAILMDKNACFLPSFMTPETAQSCRSSMLSMTYAIISDYDGYASSDKSSGDADALRSLVWETECNFQDALLCIPPVGYRRKTDSSAMVEGFMMQPDFAFFPESAFGGFLEESERSDAASESVWRLEDAVLSEYCSNTPSPLYGAEKDLAALLSGNIRAKENEKSRESGAFEDFGAIAIASLETIREARYSMLGWNTQQLCELLDAL